MGVLRQMPQHVAHLPRTGFDMSQSFAFTSSCGMILPVYQDFINVGETVYLNGELFARTQPLVNAAMADVDVYINWFFVPMPMLYQLFPSIRYATNDYFSSIFNREIQQYGATLPLTDIDALLEDIHVSFSYGQAGNIVYSVGGFGSDFDCLGKSTFRLLNHLGMNPYGIFHNDSLYQEQNDGNPTIFPMFAMAYQAIFQDYFRIEDYEQKNTYCFNADVQFDQQTFPQNQFTLSDGLFQLRYRPRHKDYFTSVKNSPLTSAANLINLDNQNVSTILGKIDNYLYDRGDTTFGTPSSSAINFSGLNETNTYSATQQRLYTGYDTTTGVIRSMFALEKLLRIIGRSKKDYDSQVLAHFGFKVPHDVKHQLSHLFEQHALLHIGEVVSTANTYNSSAGTGSNLGTISGKGYVNIPKNKQSYKFTAPVDGIVMAVYSSVPRFRYYNVFDKQNAVTSRIDFFTPEFDKLGMQPLYTYEGDLAQVGQSDRYGWQYRYQQHKQKYDRVTEAFKTVANGANNYSSWVLAHDSFLGKRIVTGGYYVPKVESFYCSPKDLDSIMVMKYSPLWSSQYLISPWLMFATDPFINDFRASVKKVSTMSTTGEPDL